MQYAPTIDRFMVYLSMADTQIRHYNGSLRNDMADTQVRPLHCPAITFRNIQTSLPFRHIIKLLLAPISESVCCVAERTTSLRAHGLQIRASVLVPSLMSLVSIYINGSDSCGRRMQYAPTVDRYMVYLSIDETHMRLLRVARQTPVQGVSTAALQSHSAIFKQHCCISFVIRNS